MSKPTFTVRIPFSMMQGSNRIRISFGRSPSGERRVFLNGVETDEWSEDQ